MDIEEDEDNDAGVNDDESMHNTRCESSVNKSSQSIGKEKTRAEPKRSP